MTYGTGSQSSRRPGGSWAGPLPEDGGQHLQVLDALSGSRANTSAMLNKGQWPGSDVDSSVGGRVQLAQAGTATMSDFGSALGPLPRFGPLARGLGLLGAAELMNEVDRSNERGQVNDAMERFGLSTTSSADILSARAYVWGHNIAPIVFWSVPYSGPVNERVACAIMQNERDNPGTLGLARGGDRSAAAAIEAVVASAVVGTTLAGPIVLESRQSAVADPELSTDSNTARAALGIAGNQSWIAHHLIPFAVMEKMPDPIQRAIATSGWTMDGIENLIALPRNFPTYLGPFNRTVLPWHAGSHPNYSREVTLRLIVVAARFPTTPNIIRPTLPAFTNQLRLELVARRVTVPGRRAWHDMLP